MTSPLDLLLEPRRWFRPRQSASAPPPDPPNGPLLPAEPAPSSPPRRKPFRIPIARRRRKRTHSQASLEAHQSSIGSSFTSDVSNFGARHEPVLGDTLTVPDDAPPDADAGDVDAASVVLPVPDEPEERDHARATEAWVGNLEEALSDVICAARKRHTPRSYAFQLNLSDEAPSETSSAKSPLLSRALLEEGGSRKASADDTDLLVLHLPDGHIAAPESFQCKFRRVLEHFRREEGLGEVMALRRERAQGMLDDIQQILDFSPGNNANPDDWTADERLFRAQFRRVLFRLSRFSGELPPSLFVSEVRPLDRNPEFFGGFSDVSRGTHRGRQVAIKRLRIMVKSAETRRIHRDFCKEALTWRQLRHPFILPFVGVLGPEWSTELAMISPWAEHGNVINYLQSQPAGSVDLNRIISEIAQGMAYLHWNKVIHGDLRAPNIFVGSAHRVQIADFGISIFTDATIDTFASNGRGSPRWMAPEQFEFPGPHGGGVDTEQDVARSSASDVYSFGMVCIELFTRRVPFCNIANEYRIAFLVLRGARPPRPAVEDCPGDPMPDRMWGLATRCWSHNMTDRPSMAQVVDFLDEC